MSTTVSPEGFVAVQPIYTDNDSATDDFPDDTEGTPGDFAYDTCDVLHPLCRQPRRRLSLERPESIDPIRVYKNTAARWGEAPDDATLQAMGKVPGYDWFVHPMSDLRFGVPEGTDVVFLSSAASGDLESQIEQQNFAMAQTSLDAFVRGGGTLIASLADNHPRGGYLVPGATGTPDFLLPSDCRTLRFGAAAFGEDGVPGTPDDHELTRGADGIPGTIDDLSLATVSMAEGCFVVHGNLVDGMQMPHDAEILMTAVFGTFEAPVFAEHAHGAGRVRVIGLTQDVKRYGLDEDMRPGVYFLNDRNPSASMTIVARTAVDPLSIVDEARALVRARDADLPIYRVSTTRRLDESLWSCRAASWSFAIFAGVAMTLAISGIYGVVSYAVGQRTHEIGIRMALGARWSQVLGDVMRHGLLLLGAGVTLGLVATVFAARALSSLLFGVSATDPLVYTIVTLSLVAVAVLANLMPARRAASIDPMQALRDE